MSVFLIVLIVLLIFVPAMRRRRLNSGRPRSPIEPGGERPALPRENPARPPLTADPASSATPPKPDPEQALMDDYAEDRISVEEYERRLDALYRDKPGRG